MYSSVWFAVRLLKAFQIDFSWYRLSSWINLTEQWPLRASMIVLHHDQNMDGFDDTVALQTVYEKYTQMLLNKTNIYKYLINICFCMYIIIECVQNWLDCVKLHLFWNWIAMKES